MKRYSILDTRKTSEETQNIVPHSQNNFLLVGRLLLIHQRWYRYHISRQGQYTASYQQIILSRQHLKLLLILLPGIVSQAPFISLLWQSSRLFDARTPHQTHTG